MEKMKLGKSGLEVSNIGLGCMGLGRLSEKEAARVINNALELGINFFDHADIYAGGKSEENFGKFIGTDAKLRSEIILQTKAGIRNGYYDFSKEHILKTVDESLNRLKTDYLDMLLLHRPDALVEPEEVAEAFSELQQSGKVRHFGVSNHNPLQIELLKKHVEQELSVNQLQFGVMHTGMVDAGVQVNMKHENGVSRDGSILDYSRLNDMTVQAWSPFRYRNFKKQFIDHEELPAVNVKLQDVGDKYGINSSAAAIAWILRHPAKIQAIVGTMTPERLTAIAEASSVKMTREEWYAIYRAAGNDIP